MGLDQLCAPSRGTSAEQDQSWIEGLFQCTASKSRAATAMTVVPMHRVPNNQAPRTSIAGKSADPEPKPWWSIIISGTKPQEEDEPEVIQPLDHIKPTEATLRALAKKRSPVARTKGDDKHQDVLGAIERELQEAQQRLQDEEERLEKAMREHKLKTKKSNKMPEHLVIQRQRLQPYEDRVKDAEFKLARFRRKGMAKLELENDERQMEDDGGSKILFSGRLIKVGNSQSGSDAATVRKQFGQSESFNRAFGRSFSSPLELMRGGSSSGKMATTPLSRAASVNPTTSKAG